MGSGVTQINTKSPIKIDKVTDLLFFLGVKGCQEAKGRTNMQRMEAGLASIGYDGNCVCLQHIGQTNDSPLADVPASLHYKFAKNLYANLTLWRGGLICISEEEQETFVLSLSKK